MNQPLTDLPMRLDAVESSAGAATCEVIGHLNSQHNT